MVTKVFWQFNEYAKLRFYVIEIQKGVFLLPMFYKCQTCYFHSRDEYGVG